MVIKGRYIIAYDCNIRQPKIYNIIVIKDRNMGAYNYVYSLPLRQTLCHIPPMVPGYILGSEIHN